MSRELSNKILDEIFSQNSSDPFLTLLTISHSNFGTVYIVNNMESITSRGNEYLPFPFKIALPTDDGETQRDVKLQIDNVSLELISHFRSVTDFVDVKLEMILASTPDTIEIDYDELKLSNIEYNSQEIKGTLILDDFLNSELTSEKYDPQNFPGIFN